MTDLLARLVAGRTDLVFDLLASGVPADSHAPDGVPLISWCAYYGDLSALRFLLAQGATLTQLGDNFDLNGAAFLGHWRLCQFLLEHGASVHVALPDTGETPLHAALATTERLARDRVIQVLLAAGADPDAATFPGRETGCFMRDSRTCGETALHRAAAYGSEVSIDLLLAAGAHLDARDAHGDSPLSWASRHLRPDAILRKLCFSPFRIHPERRPLAESLLGEVLP